jgi:hypothetical protein
MPLFADTRNQGPFDRESSARSLLSAESLVLRRIADIVVTTEKRILMDICSPQSV